jgi:hypothetical protein
MAAYKSVPLKSDCGDLPGISQLADATTAQATITGHPHQLPRLNRVHAFMPQRALMRATSYQSGY